MRGASEQEQKILQDNFYLYSTLGGITSLTFVKADEKTVPCASKPFGTCEALVPMKDLINKEDELKRLNQLAAKLQGLIKGGESKLNNQAFVSKAPAQIIEGAKAQLELNRTQLAKIEAQIKELEAL